MQLRMLLTAAPLGLILALAHAGQALAVDVIGLPGPGAPAIVGLVAAGVVAAVLLARRCN